MTSGMATVSVLVELFLQLKLIKIIEKNTNRENLRSWMFFIQIKMMRGKKIISCSKLNVFSFNFNYNLNIAVIKKFNKY